MNEIYHSDTLMGNKPKQSQTIRSVILLSPSHPRSLALMCES